MKIFAGLFFLLLSTVMNSNLAISGEPIEVVRVAIQLDHSGCKGHPDDWQSPCSGEWSHPAMVEIELRELPDEGTAGPRWSGNRTLRKSIRGIPLQAQFVVDRYELNGKPRYWIEVKAGVDLTDLSVSSLSFSTPSLQDFQEVHLIGPWHQSGEFYARPIAKIGPSK